MLKIDIEGFEFFALKSADNLLRAKRIENIIIEMHEAQLKSLGQSVADISKFLLHHGFVKMNGLYTLNS